MVFSSIDEFAAAYPKYDTETIAVYRILMDQYAKKEMEDIQVVDGMVVQRQGYLVCGKLEKLNIFRVLVPVSMNDSIDVIW